MCKKHEFDNIPHFNVIKSTSANTKFLSLVLKRLDTIRTTETGRNVLFMLLLYKKRFVNFNHVNIFFLSVTVWKFFFKLPTSGAPG